jgi:hypothetical protein
MWPSTGLLFIPQMIHMYGSRWSDTNIGNMKKLKKTCPTATLSITAHISTDLSANLDLLSERLATNCLSHGTANKHHGNVTVKKT